MEEQHLLLEKFEKIYNDEDFAAISKKLSLDDEIRKIMLELVFKFEAIYKKLWGDAYFKIIIDELYKKITHDRDFKELMTKHEVKNEKQFIFFGIFKNSAYLFLRNLAEK